MNFSILILVFSLIGMMLISVLLILNQLINMEEKIENIMQICKDAVISLRNGRG